MHSHKQLLLGQLFVRVHLFFSVLWLTAIFQKKRLAPDSFGRVQARCGFKEPVHGACCATAWATVCASASFLLSAVVDSYFPEKTYSRLLSRELGTVSRKSVHGACCATAWATVCASAAFLLSAVG